MCIPCTPYLHTSTAHPYHTPSRFSPAGPQPWSASAPLRADNPSSLCLLQLSSPPHWESSPTDVPLLSCRAEQQQPPSCDAHNWFCMHMWASPSAALLTRCTDLPVPSISPAPWQLTPCTLPVSRPSSAADCGAVWGTAWGVLEPREGRRVRRWHAGNE